MKISLIVGAAAVAALVGATLYIATPGSATGPEARTPKEGEPIVSVALPATLSPEAMQGKRAFDAICAACHGENAQGRMGSGPPLVHKIYEPSHHGDMAFVLAVEQGVRAHHWPFGNMPAQSGLTRADVATIVAYVRELQRENGID